MPIQPEIGLRPPRAGIHAFVLDGRVAARQESANHYANISWRHTRDADDIVVTTPLGQGVAELTRDATGARLATADKRVAAAADWEALSAQVFGFALPLEGMPRWLVGDVTPVRSDEQGRPLAAFADGWEIRYLNYESDAADALPALVEFQRGDIEVKLKVDAWQLD